VLQVFNFENEEKKMKTKKAVIAVLSAVLVIAFIIGCNVQLGPDAGEEQQPAPDGKTWVKLNIVDSKSNARTIIPNTSGYNDLSDDDQFDHFNVFVTLSDNTDVTPDDPFDWTADLSYTDITTEAMALEPGITYTFTVIALKDTPSYGSIKLAMGKNDLAVTGGGPNTLSITLKEIVDGEGQGTFAVSSSNIATYSTAELTLYSFAEDDSAFADELDPGTGDYVTDIDIKTYAGPFTVPSGYYRMTIALTNTNCEPVTVVEIVHIYEGFPSIYSATLPTLRRNKHFIEYDYTEGAKGVSGLEDETVTHGGSITNLPPTVTFAPPSSSFIFGAWYDDWDATANGNAGAVDGNIVNASTKIIKPLMLYAKWEPASVNVTFSSIGLGWSGPIIPDFTGSTASYLQGDGSDEIEIELIVDNASAFQSASFRWYIDGTLYVAGNGQDTITITGDIDSALNWYQAGVHTITLEANDVDAPHIPYSGKWTITCTP
jgi:hypothetical protein